MILTLWVTQNPPLKCSLTVVDSRHVLEVTDPSFMEDYIISMATGGMEKGFSSVCVGE